MHVCMHACMYVCMHVRKYVCMYGCMLVWTCINNVSIHILFVHVYMATYSIACAKMRTCSHKTSDVNEHCCLLALCKHQLVYYLASRCVLLSRQLPPSIQSAAEANLNPGMLRTPMPMGWPSCQDKTRETVQRTKDSKDSKACGKVKEESPSLLENSVKSCRHALLFFANIVRDRCQASGWEIAERALLHTVTLLEMVAAIAETVCLDAC